MQLSRVFLILKFILFVWRERNDVIVTAVAVVYIYDVIAFQVHVTSAADVFIFVVGLVKKLGDILAVFWWVLDGICDCSTKWGNFLISLDNK